MAPTLSLKPVVYPTNITKSSHEVTSPSKKRQYHAVTHTSQQSNDVPDGEKIITEIQVEEIRSKALELRAKDVINAYKKEIGLMYNDVPDQELQADKLDLSVWSVIVKDDALKKVAKFNAEKIQIRDVAMRNSTLMSSLMSDGQTNNKQYTTGLTHINLHGALHITDIGLKYLSNAFSNLLYLDLGLCSQLTDPGVRLAVMKAPLIQYLNLDGCINVKKEGLLAAASCCKYIKELSISHCPGIPRFVFMKIAEGLNQLEVINFSGNDNITDHEMKSFGLYCPNLRRIIINDCCNITDVGILAVTNKCLHIEVISASRSEMASRITDVAMLAIGDRCEFLKELNVSNCVMVSDAGLSWVAQGCRGLVLLNVNHCDKVTDAGMRSVSEYCVSLKSLHIKYCKRVTDVGIRLISAGCRELKTLDAGGLIMLTDGLNRTFGLEGLQALASSARTIEHLTIHDCFQVYAKVLQSLSSGCPLLRTLNLAKCVKVDTNCLQLIGSGCHMLQSLDLSYDHKVSDAGLFAISRGCRRLTNLNLTQCEGVTDKGLKAIMKRCKEIEILNLTDCRNITDLGLLAIADAKPPLRTLSLKNIANITDTGVSWLADCVPTLLTLNLTGCCINKDSINAIRHSWRHTAAIFEKDISGIFPLARAKDMQFIDTYGEIWKAATKIQSMYRAKRARKDYKIRREEYLRNWVATRLQAMWRGRQARKYAILCKLQRNKEEEAATRIQSLYRQKKARKLYSLKQQEAYQKKLQHSVLIVQARWRGRLARRLAKNAKLARIAFRERCEQAAIKLQKQWRGKAARKKFKVIKAAKLAQIKKQNEAAIQLQKVVKGRAARLEKQKLKRDKVTEEKRRQKAANVLQRAIRRRRRRKKIKAEKDYDMMLEQAAIRVQKVWRMRQGKYSAMVLRRAKEEIARTRAAIKIQCRFRWKKSRNSANVLRQARAYRRELEEKAARFVQKVFRGHRYRSQKKASAIEIAFKLAKEQQLIAWAALKVQAAWRGMKGRRRYLEIKLEKAIAWKEMFDQHSQRPFYYNRHTGEIRWRMPQPLLEKLPKPVCSNCEWYNATYECKQCAEYYCDACWGSVHYGGKRRFHEYRALYDFYGQRIDYGEGEFPSKWPSEMEQDDINGWRIRNDGNNDVPKKDHEIWERFYDAEKGVDIINPKLKDTIYKISSSSLPVHEGNNNWAKYKTDDGVDFYFNKVTCQSTYYRPEEYNTPRKLATDNVETTENTSISKWQKYWDEETQHEFYYNESTGESVYDRPTGYISPRVDSNSQQLTTTINNNPVSDINHSITDSEMNSSGWEKYFDEGSGQNFYYNVTTGESTYDRPELFQTLLKGSSVIPNQDKWIQYWDEIENRPFYYNSISGESVIDRPNSYRTPRVDSNTYAYDTNEEGYQDNWQKEFDPTSQQYYYYNSKGESTFDRPEGYTTARDNTATNNNDVWSKHIDEATYLEFYYNNRTGESVYERPSGYSTPKLQPATDDLWADTNPAATDTNESTYESNSWEGS